MKHTTALRTVALVLTAGLALPLAACTATPSASSSSTSSSSAAGLGERWGSCMRDAGFDVTDPQDDAVRSGAVTTPDGVDQEAFARASKECAESLGVTGASTADKQRWEREYAEVADCIREHGYPDLPEQRPGALDFQSYPRSSEDGFQQTVSACLAEFSSDTKQQQVG
ncbi:MULTISPECIES: hypothetical protein [unclassified Curtobacterium]|uniref:hypothetical protein n=1 Tax=unclassified Curtobacterium TaxID=257496 RepID=UPI000826F467|nr:MULTISPECIES: hypothetical protein [unclassified Curtobacterium]WIA97361.1 hypothetical protein QOL16_02910 [Curtobacterium sp. MCBA15_004]